MPLMSDQIFVQIPAYRDRELLPTITNLFEQASQPQRLRVIVAWQYGYDELQLEKHLSRWPNLELLKFPAAQSQGCNGPAASCRNDGAVNATRFFSTRIIASSQAG